jgi:hypothetical protein
VQTTIRCCNSVLILRPVRRRTSARTSSEADAPESRLAVKTVNPGRLQCNCNRPNLQPEASYLCQPNPSYNGTGGTWKPIDGDPMVKTRAGAHALQEKYLILVHKDVVGKSASVTHLIGTSALRRVGLVMLFATVILAGCGCGCGYRKSGDHVVYDTWDEGDGPRSPVIPGADPKTFRTFRDNWSYAKDEHAAYWDGFRIAGAEPESFVALSSLFAKDARHVYRGLEPIPGADPATFEPTGTWGDARDKSHVYVNGHAVAACDPSTFRELKGSGEGYQVDSKCVYDHGQRVPGADPRSFHVIDAIRSRDALYCYRGIAQVPC